MNGLRQTKFVLTLLAVCFTCFSGSAFATLIHVEAQATMVEVPPNPSNGIDLNDYLPVGTVVSAAVTFGVSGSTPSFPVTSASGTFTWNDGSDRVFTLDGSSDGWWSDPDGNVSVRFGGTGPTINGLTSIVFAIAVNVGVDPFAVTAPWDDLFLGASFYAFGLGVSGQGSGGYITKDVVSGNPFGRIISAVPEPAVIGLLGIGIAGLGFARGKPGSWEQPGQGATGSETINR